jgi:hypothetical protein
VLSEWPNQMERNRSVEVCRHRRRRRNLSTKDPKALTPGSRLPVLELCDAGVIPLCEARLQSATAATENVWSRVVVAWRLKTPVAALRAPAAHRICCTKRLKGRRGRAHVEAERVALKGRTTSVKEAGDEELPPGTTVPHGDA